MSSGQCGAETVPDVHRRRAGPAAGLVSAAGPQPARQEDGGSGGLGRASNETTAGGQEGCPGFSTTGGAQEPAGLGLCSIKLEKTLQEDEL